MQTQNCLICQAKVNFSARYPNYVCASCAGNAVDEDNRSLNFFNESFSGGFVAIYADTKEKRDNHICYIEGVKCRADEARFGGIVIQPL